MAVDIQRSLELLGLAVGPRNRIMPHIADLNESRPVSQQSGAADSAYSQESRVEKLVERWHVTMLFAYICEQAKIGGDIDAEAAHTMQTDTFMRKAKVFGFFAGSVTSTSVLAEDSRAKCLVPVVVEIDGGVI